MTFDQPPSKSRFFVKGCWFRQLYGGAGQLSVIYNKEIMLKKLKEIIFGKPPLEMNHEFFGKILFKGGDVPAKDDYWECELEV